MINANERVFMALDNMTKEEIFGFLEKSHKGISHIKIGLELFNKYGPNIVKELHESYPVDIFLDLKLHDIPNTVKKAIASLEGLPIKFLTVHLSGGREMLKEAMTSKEKYLPGCKLLGVSILTSLDHEDLNEIWSVTDMNKSFLNLFKLASDCKVDGVVCSAKELPIIKSFENDLITVCPGIRFEDEIKKGLTEDQKRVLSPQEAFKIGASYLVMGRSLTKAEDLSARIEYLKKLPTI